MENDNKEFGAPEWPRDISGTMKYSQIFGRSGSFSHPGFKA